MARAPIPPVVPPFSGDIDQRLSALAFAMATREQVAVLDARVTALEQMPSLTAMDYSFNLTLTAPPGSGQARLNDADQTLATLLWLDHHTAPGVDVTAILNLAKLGTVVVLQDKDDSSKRQLYNVTGPVTDHTSYTEFPVAWRAGTAPVPAQRAMVTLLFGAA